jgi:hypothetical protein
MESCDPFGSQLRSKSERPETAVIPATAVSSTPRRLRWASGVPAYWVVRSSRTTQWRVRHCLAQQQTCVSHAEPDCFAEPVVTRGLLRSAARTGPTRWLPMTGQKACARKPLSYPRRRYPVRCGVSDRPLASLGTGSSGQAGRRRLRMRHRLAQQQTCVPMQSRLASQSLSLREGRCARPRALARPVGWSAAPSRTANLRSCSAASLQII